MSTADFTDPELDLHPNETDVFVDELIAFNDFWNRLLLIYKPFEAAVFAFGLIGNLLALITFASSTKMYTPSFVYHRVLVASDLIFCINFFLNLIVDHWLSVDCRQYVFRYWFGAFFSGTLNRAITSTCGYLIEYSTLVIALDRFLALVSATGFQRWNKLCVATFVTCLIAFLSSFLHSWPLFAMRVVASYHLGQSEDMLIGEPCWNDTVVYYWINRENISGSFRMALRAKEIYNRVVRMIYPIVLSLLTLGVVVGIIRRQRRRERQRNYGYRRRGGFAQQSNNQEHDTDRFIEAAVSPDRWNGIRKRKRCERALFLMMAAVLALAFVQVAASEAHRLLGLLHPPEGILRRKVADRNLNLDERVWYFRFVLYGHQASKLLANVCTVIARSLICVLYMVMNRLFRRELLALISRCVCHGRTGIEFRRRFDSNVRIGRDVENGRNNGMELVNVGQDVTLLVQREISGFI